MNWEPKESPWSWHSPWSSGADGGPWPATPPLPRARDLGPPDTGASSAEEAPSPVDIELVDIELIDVICGVVAGDSQCTRCGRGLSQGLRIDVHESVLPDRAWVASVASRCRGWGRHRNAARVWLSDDGLHLEAFAVRG